SLHPNLNVSFPSAFTFTLSEASEPLEWYLVHHSDFGLQEDGEAKANIGIKTAPNKILKL
ncbi:MAG TPA: hypothetical protein VH796_10515, partial [Nitrososphaeraceae archaeon]